MLFRSGDSPYQCFSAFAGNPYFIDYDILKDQGLLDEEDYQDEDYGEDEESIDYGLIFEVKNRVLKKVFLNYKLHEDDWFSELKVEFEEFKKSSEFWIEDYSLYMAVKNSFDLASWSKWDEDIKKRESKALAKYKKKLSKEIEYWAFIQFLFYSQWQELKKYINSLDIKVIGDIPIYVAEDSVDTWSNPDNFKIDKKTLEPICVAGCPPDGFSETGQLWGNLIYDWKYMKKNNYSWWIARVRESLKIYDILRIDHFRGFEAYWEIPYGVGTAKN